MIACDRVVNTNTTSQGTTCSYWNDVVALGSGLMMRPSHYSTFAGFAMLQSRITKSRASGNDALALAARCEGAHVDKIHSWIQVDSDCEILAQTSRWQRYY